MQPSAQGCATTIGYGASVLIHNYQEIRNPPALAPQDARPVEIAVVVRAATP